MKNKYDILFIGGHHTSAVPLIKLFQQNGYTVKFIGHKYASSLNKFVSSEFQEITSLNVDYINLNSPKFYNVPGVGKYLGLFKSILTSFVFLAKNRPRIVISFGGYLAVPVVISAWLLRINVVTHEQTAVAGLANRVVEKFVKKIYLTWEYSKKNYDTKKVEVVGIPLRDEILDIKPKQTKNNFDTFFIQGGKQGSKLINDFIFNNIEYLTKNFKNIYHQTGKHSINNDHEIAKDLSKKYSNYKSFEYLFGTEYSNVLRDSDFILSRSGAHITYELCYLKMPAVFIPISWASHNEQYYNAVAAADYIPSVIISEKELSLNSFKEALANLKKSRNGDLKKIKTDSAQLMYNSVVKNFLV